MNVKITRRDFLKGSAATIGMAAITGSAASRLIGQADRWSVGLGRKIPGGIREVSGDTGYQRQDMDLERLGQRAYKNSDPLDYPQATKSWGTIDSGAIFYNDKLVALFTIGGGRSYYIAAGDSVRIDNINIEV